MGEARVEYAVRIDCRANGCGKPHSDDGKVVPCGTDRADVPESINGHRVTRIKRTVTTTDWVDAPHREPGLTGAHPFPVCACVQCGPPFREDVPDWRQQFHGPFGGVSWMALCPRCGSKHCQGSLDHELPCA